jgi:hypothetical protein
MYTDTFFKDKVSAGRNTCCAQLFVTTEGFVTGKPMKAKAEAHEVLEFVCRSCGIPKPKVLGSDRATEENHGQQGQVV